MLALLIISLTGIFPLLIGTSKAYAAYALDLSESKALVIELKKPALNGTTYLKKGTPAPFPGYLVEPTRLEKVLIAVKDLESTKREAETQKKYFESKLLNEQLLAEKELAAQKKEAEAVEKELKAKIADLDVWYKKPWFVAGAVTVIFIATGVLLP